MIIGDMQLLIKTSLPPCSLNGYTASSFNTWINSPLISNRQVEKYRGLYPVMTVDVTIGLWRVCEGSDFHDINDCTTLPDVTPCKKYIFILRFHYHQLQTEAAPTALPPHHVYLNVCHSSYYQIRSSLGKV